MRVCVKGKPDDAVLQNRGRGGHTTEGQSVKQGEGAAGETLRDVVKRVENMVQWLCEVCAQCYAGGIFLGWKYRPMIFVVWVMFC